MLKVGDKVRIREDLEVDKIYGNSIFVERMKRYLGESAVITKVTKVTKHPYHETSTLLYEIDVDSFHKKYKWTEEMFEPICDGTKGYTFEEVLKIGKDGDKFLNIFKSSPMSMITFSNGVTCLSSLEVNRSDVFVKYVEKKEKYVIYKVEHREGQKQYDFISDNIFLIKGMIVICDTKYGQTYGKICSIDQRYLSESEAKEYKKCNIIK